MRLIYLHDIYFLQNFKGCLKCTQCKHLNLNKDPTPIHQLSSKLRSNQALKPPVPSQERCLNKDRRHQQT